MCAFATNMNWNLKRSISQKVEPAAAGNTERTNRNDSVSVFGKMFLYVAEEQKFTFGLAMLASANLHSNSRTNS